MCRIGPAEKKACGCVVQPTSDRLLLLLLVDIFFMSCVLGWLKRAHVIVVVVRKTLLPASRSNVKGKRFFLLKNQKNDFWLPKVVLKHSRLGRDVVVGSNLDKKVKRSLFLLLFVLFKQKFTHKNCRCLQDANSDCKNRWRAR